MPRTDAQRRWDAAHMKQVSFSLNLDTDRDLLEHLESQPRKGAYIRSLIRADMEQAKAPDGGAGA